MNAIFRSLLPSLPLLVVAVPALGEATFEGSVFLVGGYLTHPLEFAEDDAAGYSSQSLRLHLIDRSEDSSWRLGYEGSAHQMVGDQPLDRMQHAVGLEWFGAKGGDDAWNLSTGVQISSRFHSDFYEAYDFREASGYLAFKRYLRDGLLARGSTQLRFRYYESLPEESFLEPSIQIELQGFLPSGTTLGLVMGWGLKGFSDPAALRVWESEETPTASLLRLGLNVAQSLSERASIRGAFVHHRSLEQFPHLVHEDLYDSPILDMYASAGSGGSASLRILGPWQVWWEPSLSYGRWDYGETLFPAEDGPAERKDEELGGSLTIERVLTSLGGAPVGMSVVASWQEQRSTLETYDLSGPEVSTGLSWRW